MFILWWIKPAAVYSISLIYILKRLTKIIPCWKLATKHQRMAPLSVQPVDLAISSSIGFFYSFHPDYTNSYRNNHLETVNSDVRMMRNFEYKKVLQGINEQKLLVWQFGRWKRIGALAMSLLWYRIYTAPYDCPYQPIGRHLY